MALPITSRFHSRIRVFSCLSARKYGQVVNGRSVRVRFAPSPTGMVHLGGLRTALFNYLFSKCMGGTFVLRIEDTDKTRIVDGALEKLEENLNWAGLVPDESPSVGGPYGPYIQSERISLYEELADKLLKTGQGYRCFCTPKRLQLLRKECARRGEVPGYDNLCRHLTDEEIQTKLKQKKPYTIRFKYEPLEELWTDLVFGQMNSKSVGKKIEGDFIIMKADGYPTYHFANVVDDHHMQISHVLRGQEWGISTPKHLQLYEAFGWQPPLFAHLPLILNKDGTKLSKRQGDIQVEDMKNSHDPNAVLNYLTTVNGGFAESTEGKSLSEMVHVFSLNLINTHSSRLQPEKLLHLNRLHLQKCFHGDQKQHTINKVKCLVENTYGTRLCSEALKDSYIERFLTWSLDHRISLLDDIVHKSFEYIWVAPNKDYLKNTIVNVKDSKSTTDPQTILQDIKKKLENMNSFEVDVLCQVFVCYCKETKMKKQKLMGVLRRCLSEVVNGPPVAEMMEILGQEETMKRLQTSVDLFDSKP